jgi:citrate lyase subunit beta/citryl-CoA lyase
LRPLTDARSLLFVPGDRPERFDKAIASGADRIVIDLEDGVLEDRKAEARSAVANWLRPGRNILLRVNSRSTADFAADLELLALPGIEAVMVPKAEDAAALVLPHPTIPLIETAAGVAAIDAIARSPRVVRLAFGAVDFCLDMGIDETSPLLDHVRAQIALASRAAGIAPPIDGPALVLDDVTLVHRQMRHAAGFGFAAKLCVHPLQVAAVHHALAPSPSELEWASALLAAAGQATVGSFRFRGRMVDVPVIERARRLIQRSGRADIPTEG